MTSDPEPPDREKVGLLFQPFQSWRCVSAALGTTDACVGEIPLVQEPAGGDWHLHVHPEMVTGTHTGGPSAARGHGCPRATGQPPTVLLSPYPSLMALRQPSFHRSPSQISSSSGHIFILPVLAPNASPQGGPGPPRPSAGLGLILGRLSLEGTKPHSLRSLHLRAFAPGTGHHAGGLHWRERTGDTQTAHSHQPVSKPPWRCLPSLRGAPADTPCSRGGLWV